MEDSEHTNTQVDENNTSNNLITLDNTISGQWIDFSGELVDHQDYITTDFITYSSSEDYFISHNSYVSYFDSEKNHIKTIRHDADDALEKYSDASLIRISFNQDRKDYIKITN